MIKSATAVGIALLVALLAACGGGEQTSTEQGTAASSASNEKMESFLKSVALGQDDLPASFILEGEGFSTNEEAASRQEMEPPEQWLARAEEQGRLLGYEATYSAELSTIDSSTNQTLQIQIGVFLYKDAKGSEAAFRYVKEQLPELQQQLAESLGAAGQGFTNVKISELPLSKIGDDRITFRISADARDPDSGQTITVYFEMVAIRHNRVVEQLLASSIGGPSKDLEGWARTQHSKVETGLKKFN